MLKRFIDTVILEEINNLKSVYGSNFQYELGRYVQERDGLAEFGVHYSENEGFAIFPSSRYYPKGVYFYFLSATCNSGRGTGFATERKWANVGKIHNDKMLIIKQGHPRNFSENDFNVCLRKLQKIFKGSLPAPKTRPDKSQLQNVAAVLLFDQLYAIESAKLGSTNNLLHQLGYDGVVDYDGVMLPIESCQGVMTWPGAMEFQAAIPTPQKPNANPGMDPSKRMEKILKGLKHKKNGSLRMSSEEIRQAVQMLPKFHHDWDLSDSRSDFYGYLMMKLDFNNSDAWKEVEWKELDIRFYEELANNPTTPIEFWQKLLNASDPNMKAVAQDKLQNT